MSWCRALRTMSFCVGRRRERRGAADGSRVLPRRHGPNTAKLSHPGLAIRTLRRLNPVSDYELIVNHIQAMARKVEELMAHEKFKHGPEDELRTFMLSFFLSDHLNFTPDLFLKNFVAANPSKSAYGFTLNRKRPGHFNLCFLANKNSTVQTWVSL